MPQIDSIDENHESDEFLDQQKQLKIIEAYSEATLQSTYRMLQYCNESEKYGITTLMSLQNQGEILSRAQHGLNEVGSHLELVENNLNKLEYKCCCCDCKPESFLFTCCFGFRKKCCKSLSKSKSLVFQVSQTNTNASKMTSNDRSNSFEIRNTPSSTQSNISQRIKRGVFQTQFANYPPSMLNTEKLISENLEQVQQSLNSLKKLASNANLELLCQNKKIEAIGQRANLTVNKVHDADKVGKRIIS